MISFAAISGNDIRDWRYHLVLVITQKIRGQSLELIKQRGA